MKIPSSAIDELRTLFESKGIPMPEDPSVLAEYAQRLLQLYFLSQGDDVV